MKRSILIAAAAAFTLAVSGMSAQACNPLLEKGKVASKLPAALLARNQVNRPPSAASIVGLWHVIHTASDGSLFLEGYDMWHSDGTEEEMANAPPATGPVCFGVYTAKGRKVDLLTHVVFLYDLNNNFQGTLNMTQSNKVSSDGNSYDGTFDAKIYDPAGDLVAEVTGTSAADRLD